METKYIDNCDHGTTAFYSTVTLHGKEGDLYFYRADLGGDARWHYCFRHGERGEYRSSPMENIIAPTRYSDSFTAKEIEACSNDRTRLVAYFLKFLGFTI